MGSLSDFVYAIGITKRLDTDIIYNEIREDPLLIDRMFITAPYRLRMGQGHPNFITINCRDDIKHQMEAIVHQANHKRLEFYDLMSQNPYLPYHKIIAPIMYGCYFSLIGRFLRIPVFSMCLAVSVFLLTGHAFIFIFIISFVVACFLDFFTCRLLTRRGSDKEQEWLNTMMKQHPEYNTIEIDRVMKEQLEELSDNLMKKYPFLVVEYYQGMERHLIHGTSGGNSNHHHPPRAVHFDDKFMLKIRQRVGQMKGNSVVTTSPVQTV